MIAATIKKREGLLRAQINEIHTRLQLLEMSGGRPPPSVTFA